MQGKGGAPCGWGGAPRGGGWGWQGHLPGCLSLGSWGLQEQNVVERRGGALHQVRGGESGSTLPTGRVSGSSGPSIVFPQYRELSRFRGEVACVEWGGFVRALASRDGCDLQQVPGPGAGVPRPHGEPKIRQCTRRGAGPPGEARGPQQAFSEHFRFLVRGWGSVGGLQSARTYVVSVPGPEDTPWPWFPAL